MKNKLEIAFCLLVLLAIGMFHSVSAQDSQSIIQTASYNGNAPSIRADRYKRMLALEKPNIVWGPCGAKVKTKGTEITDYLGSKRYEDHAPSRRCAYIFTLKDDTAFWGKCELVIFKWPGGGTDEIKFCAYRYY